MICRRADLKTCKPILNICSECNEDGMKFERYPKWYYNDAEGVINIIDVTRRIICGEALVSIVIGNFLHAMATASSEPDVEHSIDSRLELFKFCGMTTVSDVVGNSYRLHQATRFDCMYERTGEMNLSAVCSP
jgi:hypothetical protein